MSLSFRTGLPHRLLAEIVDRNFEVRPRYSRILDPFSNFRGVTSWPASQIGMLPRINADYHDCWIPWMLLSKIIRKECPDLRDTSEHKMIRGLKKATPYIGTRSYSPEWQDDVSQDQLNTTIEASTDITVLMNGMIAEMGERHKIQVFEDITREKTFPDRHPRYVHFDGGCGAHAATVGRQFEKLHKLSLRGLIPEDYNEYVEAIVMDVNPGATYSTAMILENPERYGFNFKPPRKVVRINRNMADLDQDPELRRYEARIDTITFAASLCHSSRIEDVTDLFSYLLSHRGAVFVWDWIAKTFAAQFLKIPGDSNDEGSFSFRVFPKNDMSTHIDLLESLDDKCDIRPDSSGHGKELFMQDPSRMPIEFHRLLGMSKWTSSYHMRADEVDAHHANMYAWLGYWGFIDRDPETDRTKQRTYNGVPIWEHYKTMFDKLASSRRGFSPIHDIVIQTLARGQKQGLVPFSGDRVRYNFIESYGPELDAKMRSSGLLSQGLGFKDAIGYLMEVNGVREFYHELEGLSHTQKELQHAMRITVGAREEYHFDEVFGSLGNGR